MRTGGPVGQPGRPLNLEAAQPFVGGGAGDAQGSGRLANCHVQSLNPMNQEQPAEGRELGTTMSHERLQVWSVEHSLHSLEVFSGVNNVSGHYT